MGKKKQKQQKTDSSQERTIGRAPVVAVMGHIDHGKSSLLDYIRKTNVAGGEAGGITQHISAYEFHHTTSEGLSRNITFLDTPGHEAFSHTRIRGAQVADIAILVVSAEDGVKPQTLEALKYILDAQTPYLIAINKIDLPSADINRTKNELAENGVYLEGYGGDIPSVAISAKTGENIEELLDLLLFMSDFHELTGNPGELAEGVVIESTVDKQKGLSASLIIKNGTLKTGMAVATDNGWAPVRIMEDFMGSPLREATFSSPVKIYGWSQQPAVGSPFTTFANKKEAQAFAETQPDQIAKESSSLTADNKTHIPLVVVADTTGTLEAVTTEISKLSNDRVDIYILSQTTGAITEKEIKNASSHENAFVVGFNTAMDSAANNATERYGVEVKTFSIIYELLEWVEKEIKKRTPIETVEEMSGRVKILRIFSKTKNVQVIGGKVTEGFISTNDIVKIMRRDEEIGRGVVRGLQQQTIKADKVEVGNECGLMIESRKEIAGGDEIVAFHEVER